MTLLYFFKIFCENLNIFNTDIIQIGICHSRERTTVPPPPREFQKRFLLGTSKISVLIPH